MQINIKQPGQPVADFAVAGEVVSICGISINCAQRQSDVTQTIEVRQNAAGPSEGGSGAYLAQVVIPARRYESDAAVPLPLDPNAVTVTLWPIS